FEPGDGGAGNPAAPSRPGVRVRLRWNTQFRAGVEQVVLNLAQLAEYVVGRRTGRQRQSDGGVEFVEAADGDDPRVRLGNARAVPEGGQAVVPRAGRNAVQM